MYNFKITKKGMTNRGANYFEVEVEVDNDVWQKATYFGNTTPKQITDIKKHVTKSTGAEYWTVEIQPHTSRDRDTGRFKTRKKRSV